ncbi:MAG: 5'-nucleotidase, partial [Nocardioides sp.]
TKDVVAHTVNNTIVTRTVKAPALSELVDKYVGLSAPLANRVIGSVTAPITRLATTAGESALGDVIADAQLHATTAPELGGAVIGFMNAGGIRADLTFPSSAAGEGDGKVTYGEAFTVQPFGNSLVTMTLTGAQIDTLLEQQFDNPGAGENRILQVSAGFQYSWSAAAPKGSKVNPGSIMLNGVPIDPSAAYRVTVNNFMADGGDGYAVLREGTNRLGGDVDLDALEKYFVAQGVVAPGPQDRITRLP